MIPILKVKLKDSPLIFAFEQLLHTDTDGYIATHNTNKSGSWLGVSIQDVSAVTDNHIGVPIYPLWSVLIKNKFIQKPGYYLVRCKDGYPQYCKVAGEGRKMAVIEVGIASDTSISESVMVEIFLQEIVDKLSLGRKLSATSNKTGSSFNVIAASFIGVSFLVGGLYLKSDFLTDAFNRVLNGEKNSRLIEEYAEAQKRHADAKNKFISIWPNDALALHKIFEVLQKSSGVSTYGKFEKWDTTISFAIDADHDSITSIANSVNGVNGDLIVTIAIQN